MFGLYLYYPTIPYITTLSPLVTPFTTHHHPSPLVTPQHLLSLPHRSSPTHHHSRDEATAHGLTSIRDKAQYSGFQCSIGRSDESSAGDSHISNISTAFHFCGIQQRLEKEKQEYGKMVEYILFRRIKKKTPTVRTNQFKSRGKNVAKKTVCRNVMKFLIFFRKVTIWQPGLNGIL